MYTYLSGMEQRQRSKKVNGGKTHAQTRLRKESLAYVSREMKKHKCSLSEAIDIILYDLATR